MKKAIEKYITRIKKQGWSILDQTTKGIVFYVKIQKSGNNKHATTIGKLTFLFENGKLILLTSQRIRA